MLRRLMVLKKWMYCAWAHNHYLCFPEVWGRGLKGPWHCEKCEPCGMLFGDTIRQRLWRLIRW